MSQRRELDQALQLNLAIPLGPDSRYVRGDGRLGCSCHSQGNRGQPAHTQEAKVGCIFTQTMVNEEGYPVRDEGWTTYVGAIETAEEFGRRIDAAAWRRGWGRAQKRPRWEMAQSGSGIKSILHFPDATQIVDLAHAREHLWAVTRQLYVEDAPAQRRWVMVKQDKLDNGQIERLVASLHALERSHPGMAEILDTEANYFERNKERMRYPEFRKQGFFVGSGVIEAGCKTILGRLQQSGMSWTVRGANAVIALRCCHLSGKFEDYWTT
jgi:hypothetical protein